MNKARLIYEPRIVEDIRMPFTFSSQSIYRKSCVGFNEIPSSVNWHENIEILYFFDGNGKVSINTQEYYVNAGDIIIINTKLIHQISTDAFVQYYYLIPDKDFLEENQIFINELYFTEKINDPKATEYYKAIIDSSSVEGDFRVASVRAAVLTLVAFLGQNYTEKYSEKNDTKNNDYIKKTIEFIESDLSQNFSVEDLASRVGISKYHFMREFKRVTKYSVIEYINFRRCNRAQIMLKDKNKTIFEICGLCGFETSAYFSRVFKKNIGVSPKQFRALINNPKDK